MSQSIKLAAQYVAQLAAHDDRDSRNRLGLILLLLFDGIIRGSDSSYLLATAVRVLRRQPAGSCARLS